MTAHPVLRRGAPGTGVARLSRKYAWSFLFGAVAAAVLLSAPALGQPEEPLNSARLQGEFSDAYRKGDWNLAVEIGLKLFKVQPENTMFSYNLACVYALKGETAEAVKWLGQSAAGGFADVGLMTTDSDLASIREDKGYAEALELTRQNRDRRLQGIKEAIGNTHPVVTVPPERDPSKSMPLIIALHGYGSNADDITRVWSRCAQQAGAILAAPNALQRVGDEGYSWNTLDEAEIIVMHTLKHMTESYKVDAGRVVLTGFSEGANMAFSLGQRHPRTFCGVIPVAGRFTQLITSSPGGSTEPTPKFYLMVGIRDDPRLVQTNRQAAADLKAAGVPVELHIMPGIGHNFPSNTAEELTKALDYVLGR